MLTNKILWQNIQDFAMDDANALFPFSKKLAKEQNWSNAFTLKAINEYKKFMYLCCISPTGASPSKIVDEVWHLHLTYTKNYWEDFCGIVLHKKIHHNPSNGSIGDYNKYQNLEKSTMLLYEKEFELKAPSEIWLNTKVKNKMPFFKTLFLAILIIVFFTGCNNKADFLITIFGFVVIVGILCLATIAKPNNNQNNSGNSACGTSGGCGGASCSGGCGGAGCGGGGCGGGCGGCGA